MRIKTATRNSMIAVLVLVLAAAASAQTSIEGKYKISGYNFEDKRVYPLEKMDVTLNIDRDMKIGGRSACNLYSGSLLLGKGRSMKLDTMTSTEMACSEMIGSFEGDFMNVLSRADRYDLKEGTLTFTDTSTGHFLRFQRVDAVQTPPATEPAQHETFYISNRTANCPIIAPQRCLLIKKDKTGAWEKYYDSIIDFVPRRGRFYKIEVERYGDPPSGLPGDVSIYRHKLVRILKSSGRERDIYR